MNLYILYNLSIKGDLASQIKAARRNLFSESKILHWFVQLALGLHYMVSILYIIYIIDMYLLYAL